MPVTVEQCRFNLADVSCLKVESYGDTTGIAVAGFKEMLQIPDRTTIKGIRDYAILRLALGLMPCAAMKSVAWMWVILANLED